MGALDGQNVSKLDNKLADKSEEIELAPSNLQLFLVCLCVLALLGACFAAGYYAGKRNPHVKTAFEAVVSGQSQPS